MKEIVLGCVLGVFVTGFGVGFAQLSQDELYGGNPYQYDYPSQQEQQQQQRLNDLEYKSQKQKLKDPC